MTRRLRLLDMSGGEEGTVLSVQGGGGARRRLEALGVRPGVTIVKVTGSPFGGPVIIGIGPVRLAIGYGMAGKIIVEVIPSGAV
jgi:ferrous iron transport protein A